MLLNFGDSKFSCQKSCPFHEAPARSLKIELLDARKRANKSARNSPLCQDLPRSLKIVQIIIQFLEARKRANQSCRNSPRQDLGKSVFWTLEIGQTNVPKFTAPRIEIFLKSRFLTFEIQRANKNVRYSPLANGRTKLLGIRRAKMFENRAFERSKVAGEKAWSVRNSSPQDL